MNSPKYNNKILSLYNNDEAILKHGYVPLANTIHLYKDELGLTWKEIGLITSVLSSIFSNKPIVKDKDLSADGKVDSKRRSFKYQRQKLKEKGYLETKVIKDTEIIKNEKTGKERTLFHTLGIKYDFTGLWLKIKELVERDEVASGNTSKAINKNDSEKLNQEQGGYPTICVNSK